MKGILKNLSLVLVSVLLLSFCTRGGNAAYSDSSYMQTKLKMDSIAFQAESLEELENLAEASARTGDEVAAMCFYRELGKRNRDNSIFNEAIYYHSMALELARTLKDTIGIMDILNQQGTDYRRINAYDMASECYYEAIGLSDVFKGERDASFTKAQVNCFNGLGNIFLALDQNDRAEALLRRALKGEEELGRHTGIAINTSNLGYIFEDRGQLDSAMLYYRRSFNENVLAKSEHGISLCFSSFGRVYERKGQLDSALVEYQEACNRQIEESDKWNWLTSSISMARVNHLLGKDEISVNLLSEALGVASEINSLSHLIDIFSLKSDIQADRGEWREAAEDMSRVMMYKDSLEAENQISHIEELRASYQEQQNEAALQLERLRTMEEHRQKQTIMWVSIALLAFMLIIAGLLMFALSMVRKNYEAKMSVETARKEFFTNVTHDFRTPLTVIQGQANLICSRKENSKDVASAEAIIRQCDILMELINQILDLSKVKSSVGNANWRRGNILPMLAMTVENARLSANPKNINVYYSHSPELDGTEIDFIPDFAKKIFSNIISNAVKYTREGGEINVEASMKDDLFVWKVSDNGIGIKKEELDKIFLPFFRSESVREQNGNGIGLSLVKQMADAMQGSVTVDSIEGRGSTFTVTFPVHHFKEDEDVRPYFNPSSSRSDDESGLQDSEAQDVNNANPVVLIVEDNTDIAAYISELLRDQYQIKTALNGRIALSIIEEYAPDLIITDLMMPVIDGLELCRRVKASEVFNHIPLVVVTAKDKESDRLAGIEAGADAFIIKPFNAQELQMVVHNLLESRQNLREKYSAEIKSTDDMGAVSVNNPDTDHFLSKLTTTVLANLASRELSADFIADKLCLSPSSVNRKVKSITGMSTSAFITATKISLAKKMLMTTDKSIGEISDLCGFEYQSYFTRIFKNHTGLTPVEYRNGGRK